VDPFLFEISHGIEVHNADNILEHITVYEQQLLTNGVCVNVIISEEKMKKVCHEFYISRSSDPNNVVASPGDPLYALQLVIGDFLTSDESSMYKYKVAAEKAQ
jgi:hypothetical protein